MTSSSSTSVVSRIQVPTPGELMLPSPAAIPRHCGHNWDDPAFRSQHNRVQVLHSEAVGKKYSLVASSCGSARENPLPCVTSANAARLHGSLQAAAGGVSSPSSAAITKAGLCASSGTVPGWSQGEAATGADNIDRIADNIALSTNRYDLSGRKLTFKASFSERVPESPIEKVRVRHVVITFFLEDETVAVYEPIIPSSGLSGGYLLRRTKVPLTEVDAGRRAPPPTDRSRFRDLSLISEKHLTVLDFNVGRSILIFSTDYALHSCDSFTRQLLTALGVDVPEDAPAPTDASFLDYRKRMTSGAGATLPNSVRLDPMRSNKAAKATRQRVENSGVVLRFYAVWDEETTHTAEHREHKFEFHFFMEDNTVSLRERESAATGGEVIARHFLKRMKLPKSGNASEMIDGMLAASEDPACYQPTDFGVGAVINAFGRRLCLVDADDATRAYYLSRYGIELAPPIIVSTTKPVPPPVIKAASTDLALLRREPPRAKSTQILKYELQLDKPETSDDALRRFVLTFFAQDGEIAIGELVQRNSGFHGGRVLKKQLLRDPSGNLINLESLVAGAVLKVYGRAFRITRLSPRAEAVANNMDALEEDEAALLAAKGVTKERLKQLIDTFRDHVMGRYITLAEAFRVFDQDSDGKLTEFELRMFLAKHDISRSEAEAVALITAFDPDGDGMITFQQFVQGCTYGLPNARGINGDEVVHAAATCRTRAEQQTLSVAHRSLLERLRAKLEVRHLSVAEMFRHMSTMPRKWPQVMPAEEYARNGARVTLNALTNAEKDCVVTPVQFRRVLVERIGMNISKDEMAVLLACFYPDLPVSEYDSAEDVDALPPRALRLPDMHSILTNNLR